MPAWVKYLQQLYQEDWRNLFTEDAHHEKAKKSDKLTC